MRRREFVHALGAATASFRQSAPTAKPNIVFILADDLGWSDLGCYGADLHETPNLDRLARQGVRFSHAYSASPVCSPTRASIHTGKCPARLQMTIWRESARTPPLKSRLIPPMVEENLPLSEITLAKVLRNEGYMTAHVGKWHLGNAEHYPEAHGFDINIGGTVWGAPQTYFYPYSGDKLFGGEYRYIPGMAAGKPGEYLTDRLTSEAIRVVESAGDRPFFLNLCYHSVHTPIEGKPALVERFRGKRKPGLRHQNPGYAAMVSSLDENVGRLMAMLDQRRLSANTIVVFASDNGGFIGQHQGETVTDNYPLRSGKGALYEGGIRIPLIIRSPGLAAPGRVSSQRVCSTDFYPTLLEAAGVPASARRNAPLDGISLARLLSDPAARLPREDLFFHYPHYYPTTAPVSAMISRGWKLIEQLETGKVELYNLDQDPGENTDLAPAMADLAGQLRTRLHAWRAEVRAPMPATNPHFPQ